MINEAEVTKSLAHIPYKLLKTLQVNLRLFLMRDIDFSSDFSD